MYGSMYRVALRKLEAIEGSLENERGCFAPANPRTSSSSAMVPAAFHASSYYEDERTRDSALALCGP